MESSLAILCIVLSSLMFMLILIAFMKYITKETTEKEKELKEAVDFNNTQIEKHSLELQKSQEKAEYLKKDIAESERQLKSTDEYKSEHKKESEDLSAEKEKIGRIEVAAEETENAETAEDAAEMLNNILKKYMVVFLCLIPLHTYGAVALKGSTSQYIATDSVLISVAESNVIKKTISGLETRNYTLTLKNEKYLELIEKYETLLSDKNTEIENFSETLDKYRKYVAEAEKEISELTSIKELQSDNIDSLNELCLVKDRKLRNEQRKGTLRIILYSTITYFITKEMYK